MLNAEEDFGYSSIFHIQINNKGIDEMSEQFKLDDRSCERYDEANILQKLTLPSYEDIGYCSVHAHTHKQIVHSFSRLHPVHVSLILFCTNIVLCLHFRPLHKYRISC